MPRIVASGSRDEAFRDFKAAHSQGDVLAMLLVDAEAPVTAPSSWEHLSRRDQWTRPHDATTEQCHLMVQVMESWFLADSMALQTYYGNDFRSNALPRNPDIEQTSKSNVLSGLKQASRATQKGAYDKGKESFEILARIDPAKVTAASRHAERFVQALLSLS